MELGVSSATHYNIILLLREPVGILSGTLTVVERDGVLTGTVRTGGRSRLGSIIDDTL